MNPSQMAMGSCVHTGMTDSGKMAKTDAMTTPNMATTIQRAKKMISMNRNLTRLPMMLPVRSPMVRPSFRRDMTIEPKSCTAPMKIEPMRIHTRAGSHPQIMAMAGPTMGPVPAMEVKWCPKRTVLLVATKSTPS